jgi:hypothetical protein
MREERAEANYASEKLIKSAETVVKLDSRVKDLENVLFKSTKDRRFKLFEDIYNRIDYIDKQRKKDNI